MASPTIEVRRYAKDTRLKRPRITTEITEMLRKDIVTGRLPKGSRMPSERTLASLYGVSQPMVRESLRALEMIGLVDVRHGNGTFVGGDGNQGMAISILTMLQISDADINEINQVRELLYLEAMKLAASTATTRQIDLIEVTGKAVEQLDCDDVSEMIDIHTAHFDAISDASNNHLLAALNRFLNKLIVKLQFSLLDQCSARVRRERIQALQPFRQEILEAIKKRSPTAVEAAGRKYHAQVSGTLYRKASQRTLKLSRPDLVESLSSFKWVGNS